MIVITTPTGDIGHRVLQHVLRGRESIRVKCQRSESVHSPLCIE
jgi:hypothetical protein